MERRKKEELTKKKGKKEKTTKGILRILSSVGLSDRIHLRKQRSVDLKELHDEVFLRSQGL